MRRCSACQRTVARAGGAGTGGSALLRHKCPHGAWCRGLGSLSPSNCATCWANYNDSGAAPQKGVDPMTKCHADNCTNTATHGPAATAVACWQHAGDWPEVPGATLRRQVLALQEQLQRATRAALTAATVVQPAREVAQAIVQRHRPSPLGGVAPVDVRLVEEGMIAGAARARMVNAVAAGLEPLPVCLTCSLIATMPPGTAACLQHPPQPGAAPAGIAAAQAAVGWRPGPQQVITAASSQPPQAASRPPLCGEYLGDNDGTCPQLTCIRNRGHRGPCDNTRGDVVHTLKTWPEPFAAVLAGHKRHEVRDDDRDFRVGDVLQLQEFVPTGNGDAGPYTGRAAWRLITYKTSGGQWGIPAGKCVLSIAPL